MKQASRWFLCCTLAAALALTGCGGGSSGSSSGTMSGSTSAGSSAAQGAAWRTGLGVLTEAAGTDRVGNIRTVAAAVLLDADGKLAGVTLDELELSVSADGTGKVTTPTDTRTKRQKGKDYPLAEVSGLKKGWAEQADAFGDWLKGKTPDEVKKLKTDADGKPTDADLLSGCTIAVDRYRDAIVRACENAQVLGAARGDTVKLGVEVAEMPQGLTGTDDKDAQVQAKITLAVVTMDENARVTSAIGDMTEPELTVSADGTVSAPAGAGVHQKRAGRPLRNAQRKRVRQGMVRAQRRLVRLSEGQKRRGDRQALRRRHGCRPEGAVHHLSYRPAKSGAEGHGGAVIIKTGCPSAQKVRGDFLWIPPQAQSRKGYVHTFPQKAGLRAGQSSALCKKIKVSSCKTAANALFYNHNLPL